MYAGRKRDNIVIIGKDRWIEDGNVLFSKSSYLEKKTEPFESSWSAPFIPPNNRWDKKKANKQTYCYVCNKTLYGAGETYLGVCLVCQGFKPDDNVEE